MAYYLITEGTVKIDHIYAGQTKDGVVEKARSMIDRWPEYEAMDNDEIIYLAENETAEFDLVKIPEAWPGPSATKDELIAAYERHWGG